MRVHKVGLLLSSPILTTGLQEILHQTPGLSAIDISLNSTPESYPQRISNESPSLMIVDPFTAGYCPVDIPSMLLTTGHVPDFVREEHASTISIFDNREAIISKIRSLIAPSAPGDQRGSDLSPRERDVIRLIVKGLSNKEIAAEMHVSVNTVMTHRRNIASKLEIHSPAGLTIFAIATGMVKLEDVAL